ncbi:MAG: amidohydrolase [Pedobacter sp.]|nr:MAG: amidohydrolase [Pedobacter sp.]
MLTYISASKVYPVSSAPLVNGVLALESDGTIAAIYSAEEFGKLNQPVTHFEGSLIPGLINTHCHLELSHLRGKIAMHTGLPAFVQQVIRFRGFEQDAVNQAMIVADQEMYANGIVAVGDISNLISSKPVKLNSKLYYYTFVEAMGFNPARAAEIFADATDLLQDFEPLDAAIAPHAPYSVSENLFALIKNAATSNNSLQTIHNQETPAENEFFERKTGDFLQLYKFLGLDLSFYNPSGKSALQTILPNLSTGKTLLVHNTESTIDDITFANETHQQLYWCLCPNANLYIENKLPDVQMLLEQDAMITLGTDSLASNTELNIVKEMQTLQQQKNVSFETSLRWATANGAEFLGIADQYGSLEIGKKPGIVLLGDFENEELTDSTTIKRLF